MKKKHLIFAVLTTLLYACGSDSQNTDNDSTQDQIVTEPEVVVSEYQLVSEQSSANWERTLDQKPTKQKVKLFGKMVDVELGEIKMTTNGTVAINEGGLTVTDDNPTSAHIVFDMASFQFAKEKGDGLFNVKEFPNSTLVLNDFADSTASGTITIQETNKDIEVSTKVVSTDNGYNINGSFTLNTLDFPLREQVKAKDVNKDEIKVDFELTYTLSN